MTTKYPWSKKYDTPEIIDIPPDMIILAEYEELKSLLAQL